MIFFPRIRFKNLLQKYVVLLFLMLFIEETSAGALVKDNFQNKDLWVYLGDEVMGGVSNGSVIFNKIENDVVALLSGNVSTKNNGGFIQIRREVNNENIEKAKFIKVIAKGNNQKYFVHLRTTGTILPWQYYQSAFTVDGEFNEYVLPINEFRKSGLFLANEIKPGKITSVGLVAFGRDHRAELFVKEISFHQ